MEIYSLTVDLTNPIFLSDKAFLDGMPVCFLFTHSSRVYSCHTRVYTAGSNSTLNPQFTLTYNYLPPSLFITLSSTFENDDDSLFSYGDIMTPFLPRGMA